MKTTYVYKNEEEDTLKEKLSLIEGLDEENLEYIGDLYIEGEVPKFLDVKSFFGWKIVRCYKDSDGNSLTFGEKNLVKLKHNFLQKIHINTKPYFLYFDEDTSRIDIYFFVYIISEEDYAKILTTLENDLDLKDDYFFGKLPKDSFVGGLPKSARKLFYVKHDYKDLGNLLLECLA